MKINIKKLIKFTNTSGIDNLINDAGNLPDASFLMVTYNRCPNKKLSNNPLFWSIITLLNNKFYNLNDFIIVDDFSNDYTRETVNYINKKYNKNLRYYRNKAHRGCSLSRKIGMSYAKNRLIFMGDDDCLYPEYFIFAGLATYGLLKNKYKIKNLAVLNFPVYERNIFPHSTERKEKIGKLYLNKTFFYHNFDKLPETYIRKPKYLDNNKNLLMPIKVDTFYGVNLCDKVLIKRAGNYLDLSGWSNSYSEHIELSHNINKKGYNIYHQPDPKLGCIHLKYGAMSRDKLNVMDNKYTVPGINSTIKELFDLSDKEIKNTGARLNDEEFHINEIGSLFSFYLKISKKLGVKFALKEYKSFVVNNQIFSSTPSRRHIRKANRKQIWIDAIKKGCNITHKQTSIDYTDIYNYLLNKI